MGMIYQERHGFTVKTVLVLAICLGFTVLMVIAPIDSLVVEAVGLLLFGCGGLLVLANALSRKVALRLDEGGITLGGPPLRYRSATRHVPWAEVESIVLWRQHSAAALTWIGVLRHPAAPPLPGARQLTPTVVALSGAPTPRLLECAASVNGWKINTPRLSEALRSLAPSVPLIDHR
ncbi:hypothetical protein ABZ319_37535 [Nocardia sp. NPDC005978]|uniref:hypothetical protein n=1 Tax=Nocardia sp. NPDC005978 TaxID=3156725 RepID=UPI0033B32693